jgi:hypothetical protein
MKITVKKVRRKMTKKHGWNSEMQEHNEILINYAIKDILSIVDEILKREKGISIK